MLQQGLYDARTAVTPEVTRNVFNQGFAMLAEGAAQAALARDQEVKQPHASSTHHHHHHNRKHTAVKSDTGSQPSVDETASSISPPRSEMPQPPPPVAQTEADILGIEQAYGALGTFIKRWRQHFLTTMRPGYLSSHWNVDHVKPNDYRQYN